MEMSDGNAVSIPSSLAPAGNVENSGYCPEGLWFEVSGHSGRVHLHLSHDGSRPLGLSLPLGSLVGLQRGNGGGAEGREQGAGLLVALVEQYRALEQQRREAGGAGDAATREAEGGSSFSALKDDGRVSFVGPFGLVCMPQGLDPKWLREALLEDAQAFARDWAEQRAVTRSRLQGLVLSGALQDAVEEATAAAVAAGAFGSSTSRYVQDAAAGLPPPLGAEWRAVRVQLREGTLQWAAAARLQRQAAAKDGAPAPPVGDLFKEYRQAFTTEGCIRLCLNCSKPVADCSLPWDSVLQQTHFLYCGPRCECTYYLKASSGAIRRALGKLERGVCTMCKLDCRELVAQLQCIKFGSKDWQAKREAVLRRLAPALADGKGPLRSHHDRLVQSPTEGNAWHADHIIAGGRRGGAPDPAASPYLDSPHHHALPDPPSHQCTRAEGCATWKICGHSALLATQRSPKSRYARVSERAI